MLASKDTWKDVRKYYESTYIICPEYDPKKFLHVDQVTDTSMLVQELNGDKGIIHFSEAPYTIQNPLPIRRLWFQFNNTAVFLTRIPARMWRKGISGENTQALVFTSSHEIPKNNLSLSTSLLQAFLETGGMELSPTEEESSTALNSYWALRHKDDTVFLLNSPVGKYSKTKQTLSLLKEFRNVPLPTFLKDKVITYV